MRAITQTISALLLGCSSFALSNTAQADSGITLVYSTGSHVAHPYSVGSRYYAPRGLHRDVACALPYRGHSHGHRHDHRKHGYSHRAKAGWIDRHGYHHRDSHRDSHKNSRWDSHRDRDQRRDSYRHDGKKDKHRKSSRDHDRSQSHMTYNSRGKPY